MFSGKSEKFVDTEVVSGKTYYYTLYVKSTAGSFSGGSIIIESVSPISRVVPEKINTATTAPTTTLSERHEEHSEEEHQAFLAIKRISDNAEVEKSVETLVAPTLAGVTIFNIFSSISLINLIPLIHLLFFEPFVFFGRRNRVGWGRVYNSVNKHPVDLAMVRLIDKRTGKVVQSKVTDSDGRFAFMGKPGEYALQVSKDNFTFPSQYLKGVKDDGQIFDIYRGSTFEVSGRESLITANIPVDPPGDHELPVLFKIQAILKVFQGILSWVGLPLTLFSLIVSPKWFMWPLLLAQFLLFMLYKRISRPVRVKNWGIVYDEKTKKPIERAIVRLYNVNHDRLARTEVTDSSGRYHFLAGNGKYYIVCESSSYERIKTPIMGGESKVIF